MNYDEVQGDKGFVLGAFLDDKLVFYREGLNSIDSAHGPMELNGATIYTYLEDAEHTLLGDGEEWCQLEGVDENAWSIYQVSLTVVKV